MMNSPSAQEMSDFSERINTLWKEKNIHEAKRLLMDKVSLYPNEYYLWTTLAQVSSCLREYHEALVYSKKAMSICSDDVLVLYNHAGALIDTESYHESLLYCQQILRKSIGAIARNGEGVRWAESIKNDTMYLKSVALFYIGDYNQALRVIKQLLKLRRRGLYSDFSKRQIMDRKKMIEHIISKNNQYSDSSCLPIG